MVEKLPMFCFCAAWMGASGLELPLAHPAPYLPELLAHISASPVPSHLLARGDTGWARPGRYVGNGPYTLKEIGRASCRERV